MLDSISKDVKSIKNRPLAQPQGQIDTTVQAGEPLDKPADEDRESIFSHFHSIEAD